MKININKTECPNCLGTGEVMTAKKTRGFEYKCNLCNGEKIISKDLAEDYMLSLDPNEETFIELNEY